jgi:hypothetical protein
MIPADNEIMNFLLSYAGKFDMYVEDECAAYVRYCFKDPMDAAIFRSRFAPKSEPFRPRVDRLTADAEGVKRRFAFGHAGAICAALLCCRFPPPWSVKGGPGRRKSGFPTKQKAILLDSPSSERKISESMDE